MIDSTRILELAMDLKRMEPACDLVECVDKIKHAIVRATPEYHDVRQQNESKVHKCDAGFDAKKKSVRKHARKKS